MEAENRAAAFGARVAAVKREIRARSQDGIERRTVRSLVEVRATEGDGFEFRGNAAVFGSLSEDLGGWFERVDPAFFDAVLSGAPDVRALFNHDPNLPLARSTIATGPGSLVLRVNPSGLGYRFTPTPTSYAADLETNVRAGVVDQSSFAFRVGRGGDSWEEDGDGRIIRTLLAQGCSALFDVSPVTYGAYTSTDVDVTSRDADVAPAPPHERDDDEPAEQRGVDGVDEDRPADGTPDEGGAWRLAHVLRSMAAIEAAGDAPAID